MRPCHRVRENAHGKVRHSAARPAAGMDRPREGLFPRRRPRLRIRVRSRSTGKPKQLDSVRQGPRPPVRRVRILQAGRRQQGRKIRHLLRLPLDREPGRLAADRHHVGQVLRGRAGRHHGAAGFTDHEARRPRRARRSRSAITPAATSPAIQALEPFLPREQHQSQIRRLGVGARRRRRRPRRARDQRLGADLSHAGAARLPQGRRHLVHDRHSCSRPASIPPTSRNT